MLARLLAEHGREAVPWFTADEAYGDNPGLCDWVDAEDLNYVMAISCDHRFATATGRVHANELAAAAPKRGWQRLSCGEGSKGQRLYDWLLLDPGTPGGHLLLVRRSISKPSEAAYYVCRSTIPVPVVELVRVAGSRWGVEETFQFAKNETGLDHYQVRKDDAWYRHITLSMLAAAFLAVTAHRERQRDAEKGGEPLDNEPLIPLSCNEIRRLWAIRHHPTHPQAHTDHWSRWRRIHLTRAKRSHYQRQRLKHQSMRL